MTPKEFMEAALAGKKLKLGSWHFRYFISYDFKSECFRDEEGKRFLPLFSGNWELCEEPKKKKQVWEWRFWNNKHSAIRDILMTEVEANDYCFRHDYTNKEKLRGPFEVDDI